LIPQADLVSFVDLAMGFNVVNLDDSGIHWSNNTCTVLTGDVTRYSDATSGIVKETFTSG